MKYILVSACLCLFFVVSQQFARASVADSTMTDSTKSNAASAARFGLSFGFDYSLLSMRSNPYFLENGSGLGEASAINSPGLSIGMLWYEPLREKTSLRFGLEATIMRTQIEYPTGKPRNENSQIYPLTIEIPVAFIFGRHFRYDLEAKSLFKTGVMAGIRPVIPLSLFSSIQPVTKPFNLNVDLGISKPIALKKSIMRTELFFSYGLFNIIGKDETSYKTSSISFLGRNFVGLRMFFN